MQNRKQDKKNVIKRVHRNKNTMVREQVREGERAREGYESF